MNKIKVIALGLLMTAGVSMTSCLKEYTDPSSVTDAQVVSSVDGLIGLCSGMQLRYTVGRQSPVYTSFTASGMCAGEQKLLNLGNTDELNLGAGGSAVTGSNSVVTQLWAQSFLLIKEANLVIDNLGIIGNAATKSTVQAYAHYFKAAAIGTLATYFEQMPITLGKNQAFVTRQAALANAIALLEGAESVMNGITIPADVAGKLPTGFDLKNSIVALQARLNLMAKDYGKALAAANKVDLTKKSEFRYDAVNTNPIFFNSYSNRNILEPTNKFLGLPTAIALDTLNDKRYAFQINPAASNTINLGWGLMRSNTSSVPSYLPGEIRLIKAECLAETNLTSAITELNGVIQKKAASDPWAIGADIAAGYTGASVKGDILTEIYRQRCIELAYLGLRLEDSRRIGRPVSERTRDFFPYPQSERDNNTSTPPDPAR